jgi:peptidoglycan-associated lipoprotein
MISTRPLLGALALGSLALAGCATKGYVNDKVAASEATTNGRLDSHEQRMAGIDQTAQDALQRATAAGKLAEGKFVYQVVLSDDAVHFPVDKSKLSPEADSRIAELAEKLKSENKNVYLEIQGHTDATGSPETNKALGMARAEAVRLQLNKDGVPLNRMATISYGEEAPAADNHTRQGRAQNRRVVIVVLA